MLPYVYRVTKYDPADRDEHGHYIGAQGVTSDRGEYEGAYLRAVAAFAADAGVDRLTVREPGVPSLVHFGTAETADDYGLDAAMPNGLQGFHDGAAVQLPAALVLVRSMLRDSGAWCRLEADGLLEVHVGLDQYLYVCTSRPSENAVARVRALGLCPENLDASPYAVETEAPGGSAAGRRRVLVGAGLGSCLRARGDAGGDVHRGSLPMAPADQRNP